MSTTASINIKLYGNNPIIEIINELTKTGWQLRKDSYASSLPLENNKKFNWQPKHEIGLENLAKILQVKELSNETVDIFMHWQNTNIGGSFVFWNNKDKYATFSFHLNAIRPTIRLSKDYEISDFKWYLERLLPLINNAFGVQYFSCEEHK